MVHYPTGKIREELSQPDSQKRLEATRNLMESAGRLRADLLVPQLRDPSRAVQDAADESLRALADAESVALLLPLLSEDEASLRNQAASILGEIIADHLDLVPPALAAFNDDARILLIEALGVAGAEASLPLIESQCESENVNLRNACAMALGSIGSIKALPRLVKMLADDEWVRFSAIESLSELDDPSVLPTLIDALRDARDKPWYAGVLACFIEMKRVEAVPFLIEELGSASESHHPDLVAALVEILELNANAVGDLALDSASLARATPKISALLSSTDPWVAFRAAATISHLGGEDFKPALIKAAKDERDLVSAGAQRALAKLAQSSDVEQYTALADALGDRTTPELTAALKHLQGDATS